jgi:zinc protease
LSYSVGSSFSAGSQDARADFGLFAIYAPQNRNKVDAAMREEVQRLLSEPVPTEEFDTARKALLLARQVARNQDSAIASRLNGYLSIDRTMAWDTALEQQIAALTPQQVQAALQRHLRLDQLSIVTAGDFRDKGNSSAAR